MHIIMLSINSRTCLELADVCREIGLPPGVLNILTGLGHEAGAPLASHPNVDKVQLQLLLLFFVLSLLLEFLRSLILLYILQFLFFV